jgi:tetratricopeptide (TPR) repeat protein
MKEYEQSDSLYEQALKLDPNSDLILNNYGYSLSERGLQLERALEMATRAVKADSTNPSYLDTIGWVYYKLGNYVEAERYVRKAIDQGEASAVVHEHLGDVYFKLGEKEKAVEWWKKALERAPDNQGLKEKIERGSL